MKRNIINTKDIPKRAEKSFYWAFVFALLFVFALIIGWVRVEICCGIMFLMFVTDLRYWDLVYSMDNNKDLINKNLKLINKRGKNGNN